MAGKKIGLVLALDGEKEYTQAIQNANKESRLLKTELKNLSQTFDGNANSMEALRTKQELLTKQQDAYQRKLESAKAGLENAKKNYNKQSDALDELKKKLENAQKAQKSMEDAGDKSSDSYKEQCRQVEELSDAVGKQTENTLKASGRVSDWNQRVAQSEGELRKTNKALEQNEQYLKEAEQASDHCATSIDKMGKEVKNTSEEIDDASQKTSTFGDVLKANLTGAAIISGVKKIGSAAKEAAKYAVEVGSSFEAAMSEVAAISGATTDQLAAMEEKAKELGSTTKFSATEAAEAFKYMSLAGWSTSDMLSGIDGIMNLAAASGMELASASDMVTDYLSAFGMQAKDSAYMADLLAYAQSNSNTTAEQLGEAYKNSAANLNAAGQDIETVTSLLEAMANQGLKGSEAGTALSAMMRDITAKMKDGKIAIGDTNIEVMDAAGNYRDLTDILTDVESATDGMGSAEKNAALQATFTSDSIKGLNLVLADGMTNVSGYEDALRKSDGAAKDMSDTMQDNLKGSVTELGSAVEGLGIAAYDYVSGPLADAVDGVTGVISGITELITPQKTVLESFIEDIKASNDEVQKSLDSAQQVMDGASGDVASLEAYKQTLVELNEQESLTEFQKYQVKTAVDALAQSIPELAAAFDDEAGKINLTSSEIAGLIENQEALIKQQAYAKASQEAYEGLANAQLNQAKAKSALDQALKAASEEAGQEITSVEQLTNLYNNFGSVSQKTYKTVLEAEKAFNGTNDAIEEAEGIVKTTEDAINSLTEAEKENTDSIKANAQKEEQLAIRKTQTAETAKEVTESVKDETAAWKENEDAVKASAETQREAAASMLETYHGYVDEIKSGLQDKISLFDKFETSDGGEDQTVEKMTANLDSQIEAYQEYAENLATVKDHVGKEIAPEFMQYLESMGMDGANTLKHIIATFDEGETGSAKVKEMSDKWVQAMDMTEGMAEVGAANKLAYEAAMGELGSSDADFTALSDAVKEASSLAVEGWSELSAGTKTALEQTIQTAKDCGIQIPEGLTEGIASGEVSAEEAIGQLNGAIQGRFDGLAEVARKSGVAGVDELVAGIESGEQDVVSAYNTLISLLSAQTGTGQMSQKGQEDGSEYASGIGSTAEAAGEAAGNVAQSAMDALEQSEFGTAGTSSAQKYLDALNAAKGQAAQAGGALGSVARNALASYQNAFYNTGYNISAGVASGIRAGSSGAINAARDMASAALRAAKEALDIHSPSKKFEDQVGAQIPAGTAFGISKKAALAGKAAKRMSNKVYTNAVSWLSQYKKSQQVSLADEKWYWNEVLKCTKKGTTAYNNVLKKIQNITISEITATGLSSGVASKISNNFGVSKTTGTGKKKKTKDTETYYSEIYSAAEKYISNQQVLNDWSLQQELAYWNGVKGQLKKGTQAWYDATKQINSVQAQMAEAEAQKIETQANVQKDILDKYKTYYKVSAKAEADYWNAARKQFKVGTDERIEADQNYFNALQDLYDQRKELDEDYADNSKEINDKLIEDIEELQDAYKDAVKSRKEDILSQMNLFEAFDSEGYDSDTLLYNLKTQVAGLALWEQQLEELGKKGLSSGLMEELQAMGPDAAASIYSLNQMTAEQLDEYNKLWQQKNALAESQAVKENESLRQDTNKQITQLRLDAQAELNALNADYRAAISELYTGMSSDLANLVNKAGSIGEDAVSSLIGSIGKAANSVDTYNSTTQVVNTVSAQLAALEQEGSVIGKNALDGLLEGMQDETKINLASKNVIQSIKKAMEEEAEIHSPARLFRRETGPQIPAGVALGMEDGTKLAAESAKTMMQDILAASQAEMERQQASMQSAASQLDYSGIMRLNRLTEQYKPQSPVVNINNDALVSLLGTLITKLDGLADKMDNQQLVLDTGVVAAQMQPLISQESAAVTIRKRRGRL